MRRSADGLPVPRRLRVLAPGFSALEVRRPDERTLVIHAPAGWFISPLAGLFRNDSHPLAIGERVELTGITAEVTAVRRDGQPLEAAFRFAVPLEDSSLRWLQWKEGDFRPFVPPPIGRTITMAPAHPPF